MFCFRKSDRKFISLIPLLFFLSCATTKDVSSTGETLRNAVITTPCTMMMFAYKYHSENNNWPNSCISLARFVRKKGMEPDSIKTFDMCKELSRMNFNLTDTTMVGYFIDCLGVPNGSLEINKVILDSFFVRMVETKNINTVNDFIDSVFSSGKKQNVKGRANINLKIGSDWKK